MLKISLLSFFWVGNGKEELFINQFMSHQLTKFFIPFISVKYVSAVGGS